MRIVKDMCEFPSNCISCISGKRIVYICCTFHAENHIHTCRMMVMDQMEFRRAIQQHVENPLPYSFQLCARDLHASFSYIYICMTQEARSVPNARSYPPFRELK